MKYAFLLTIWFSSIISLCGQSFSGEIASEIRIIPKMEGLNADSILSEKFGTHTTYLITDGYYKSTYFRQDKMTYSYTYQKGLNKMFDEQAETDYVTYRDSRKDSSTDIEWQIYPDRTTTILGYECFMAKTVYETHTAYNFYAKDLRVNYEDFVGHNLANWYNRLKQLDGAMLMKVVSEYPQYTQITEATQVNVRDVALSEFDLPGDKPVYASFQALEELVDVAQPAPEVINCYRIKSADAPRPHDGEKQYTYYLSLVVMEDGSISHAESLYEDEHGLHEIAMDIILNCGFEMIPGKINGKPVSSEAIIPLVFIL